jgi:hypothetical protein
VLKYECVDNQVFRLGHIRHDFWWFFDCLQFKSINPPKPNQIKYRIIGHGHWGFFNVKPYSSDSCRIVLSILSFSKVLSLDTKAILWLNDFMKTRNKPRDTGSLPLKDEIVTKLNRGTLVAPAGYGEERWNSLNGFIVQECSN